jgi:hypothetical protein
MFVKIINHDESEAIAKGSPRTKCYDCMKYLLYPGDTEENVALSIDVGEQSERVMMVPKKNHTIIIMNNDGKYIDKYCW